MNNDFEGPVWAEHHQAVGDGIDTAINKLGYMVGVIIARRRAEQRQARRAAEFN